MGNYLIRAVCTALSESGKPLLKALQFVHSEATERSLLIAREMERDTAKASSAVQYFYSCLILSPKYVFIKIHGTYLYNLVLISVQTCLYINNEEFPRLPYGSFGSLPHLIF